MDVGPKIDLFLRNVMEGENELTDYYDDAVPWWDEDEPIPSVGYFISGPEYPPSKLVHPRKGILNMPQLDLPARRRRQDYDMSPYDRAVRCFFIAP